MILFLAVLAVPVILAVGFVRGPRTDPTRRIPRPYRMATSVLLVATAMYPWLGPLRGTAVQGIAGWMAVGMAFGLLGDLIMAHLIPTPNRLIFGILAFGLGHLAYIAGFIQAAAVLGLRNPLTQQWVWLVYLAVVTALWWLAVRSPHMPPTLNYAALVYAGLIGIMAGAAAGLAVQDPRFLLPALGGILFLASDLILGNHEFRKRHWPYVQDVIWTTYILGQALIILTPALAAGQG